ncbi:FUSC family protein [Corallococcus sp. RDP092CA]|uniref:FUSC family protein n=1 Tax=Corallococcus sp. RDP092CA TaxID=3109369 RepID=UPI0035B3F4F2
MSPAWKGRVLFSVKTFCAAALALAIAFHLGLERPSWAFGAVYVVSQPLSGATRLKSLYRVGGTALGGIAALLLAALFVNTPFILTVAIIAWASLCTGLSMLDRRPTNYLFVMLGVTPMIAALPGGGDLSQVFQTVMWRVTELGLGCLCLVFVDSLFLPQSARPVLGAQVGTWLASAERWMLDALSDDAAARAASAKDRKALAAQAQALNALAVNARLDLDHELRREVKLIDLLREEALQLLPVLASIQDRAEELVRHGHALPGRVAVFREELRAWMDAGAPARGAVDLRRSLHEAMPPPDATGWGDLLLADLLRQLRRLVGIWADCKRIQRRLADEPVDLPRRMRVAAEHSAPDAHQDAGLVLWTVATAWVCAGVVGGLWYLLEWPHGVGAFLMASLLVLMFSGTSDDPRPVIKLTTLVLIPASVAAGVYLFGVFPNLDSMPLVLLALAVLLLPLGLLGTNPATSLFMVFPAFQITVENNVTSDFTSFVNGQLATVVGLVLALTVVALMRVLRVEDSIRRLLRAGWRDVAELAETPDRVHRRAFNGRMLDRLGLLVPKLAQVDPAHEVATADVLTDLRVGQHVLELEEARRALPPPAVVATDAVLAQVARHFQGLRQRLQAPPEALLAAIDAALGAAASHGRRAALALTGLRRGLFPLAPPYARAQPAAAPALPPPSRPLPQVSA